MSHKDSKTDTINVVRDEIENKTGSVRDAWISWNHHQGGELRDADSLSIATIMQAAFTAGWEFGGGNQRLEVIETLNAWIGEHCAEDIGKACDEDCEIFQRLIGQLGGEPHYGDIEE